MQILKTVELVDCAEKNAERMHSLKAVQIGEITERNVKIIHILTL